MRAQSIQQCVSYFMGHGIVRQAGIHITGKLSFCLAAEKAKGQFAGRLIIMRIVAIKSSWPQQQLSSTIFGLLESPRYMAAQRHAKSGVDNATDRIHHLIL